MPFFRWSLYFAEDNDLKTIRNMITMLLLIGIMITSTSCSQKDSELVVGAASSLTNIMEEVATDLKQKRVFV